MGEFTYNIVHGSLMGFRKRADTMIRFCGSGLAWKSGKIKSEIHGFNLFTYSAHVSAQFQNNLIHKQNTFLNACTL